MILKVLLVLQQSIGCSMTRLAQRYKVRWIMQANQAVGVTMMYLPSWLAAGLTRFLVALPNALSQCLPLKAVIHRAPIACRQGLLVGVHTGPRTKSAQRWARPWFMSLQHGGYYRKSLSALGACSRDARRWPPFHWMFIASSANPRAGDRAKLTGCPPVFTLYIASPDLEHGAA